MKKNILGLSIALLLTSSIFGQDLDLKKQKARELLSKASEAVHIKKKVGEIKGLLIADAGFVQDDYTVQNRQIKSESSTKTELSYESPCKIRHQSEYDTKNFLAGKQSDNQSMTEDVLNEGSFYRKMEGYVDGKKIDLPLKYPTKEEGIANLKQSVFSKLFPILFDTSNCFPYDFSYIGIAESKDGRANVIEAISPYNITYRLFFDEKTNLLLMIIETSFNKENQKRERKYFYSNYKELDGFKVATVVKIEAEGKFFESREIKSLKVNLVFKPNTFQVREK